jgi:3-dehydroquinate dehydratase type I
LTLSICVSILPKTTTEALRLMERAEEGGADFIEVRLDNLEDLQGLADLAAHTKAPKIATNKRSSATEKQRQQSLLDAAKNGFNYVDLDLSNKNMKQAVKETKALGAKCVLSFHDFNESLPLSELNSILEKQILNGADVCKIVTTPTQVEENLTLLQFVQAASKKARTVCFGMGELGKTSRLLSPAFGAFFTFASLERGSETAPGQMTIEEMNAAYKLLGLKRQ